MSSGLGRWNDSAEGTQPSNKLEKNGKVTTISTHTKRNYLNDLRTVLDLQSMHRTSLEVLQVSQSGVATGPVPHACSQLQSSMNRKFQGSLRSQTAIVATFARPYRSTRTGNDAVTKGARDSQLWGRTHVGKVKHGSKRSPFI